MLHESCYFAGFVSHSKKAVACTSLVLSLRLLWSRVLPRLAEKRTNAYH